MAQLLDKSYEPQPALDYKSPSSTWNDTYDAQWEDIEKQGLGVITFPVGDGSAVYIARSLKPLKLQHVNYCDGWHADPALIRGLRRADVEARMEQRKKIKELFPGKKS